MAYDSRLVANALLHKAKERGQSLSHLKLQKLLFFTQAWGLALHDDPVMDDYPEAWDYGPVFPALYHELKRNGSRPIEGYLEEPFGNDGKKVALVPGPADTKFWNLVDQVWDRYGSLSAGQLSSLSHVSGGPWDQARKGGMRNIARSAITDFYRSQLPAHAA
jgi:uncharacterized phage-associated protein